MQANFAIQVDKSCKKKPSARLCKYSSSFAVKYRHCPAGRSPREISPCRMRRSRCTLSPAAAHMFRTSRFFPSRIVTSISARSSVERRTRTSAARYRTPSYTIGGAALRRLPPRPAAHPYAVCFAHAVRRMRQTIRHLAVIGEEQQSFRHAVEPTDREKAHTGCPAQARRPSGGRACRAAL